MAYPNLPQNTTPSDGLHANGLHASGSVWAKYCSTQRHFMGIVLRWLEEEFIFVVWIPFVAWIRWNHSWGGVPMRILSLMLWLMATSAVAKESVFQLKLDNQELTEVCASGVLAMTTSFGSASIDLGKIDAIRFEENATIVFASDGAVLWGEPDWSGVTFEAGFGTVEPARWKSLQSIRRARLVAGKITTGRSVGGLGYYLRAPEADTTEKPWPTLVLLHGSNMNARAYMDSVIAKWPELAKTHLLIGVNGEKRNTSRLPGPSRYNYTYVNFAGKSKFNGYPGTDRESPALVAELLTELRERLPIAHCYLIGHSQGAFLTYSVTMNFPELIDGAIPVSGGVIVQALPNAYDDQALIAEQKKTPIAIVHGVTDQTVGFQQATRALEAFETADFPRVKLFRHKTAGHRFMLLPVDEAVAWLDAQRALASSEIGE